MTEDQRHYSRFPVSWRARLLSRNEEDIEGKISNISLSGGYLELPNNLACGHVLLMETHPIINRQTYTVHIKAKVIRSTILSGDRGFGLGLKIIKIADADKKIFNAAISTLENSLNCYN